MEPKPTDEPHHDREIGRRDWLSLISVLFVQTQNAFNDNFVKMVLIGLGLAVAQGVIVLGADVGENIQFILTALIPIAFILGAPISGWISDRFSKKWVLIYCVLLQLGIFVLIYLAVIWRQVGLAIFGYFLLSVQSTLFSPAKQGILKELVGGKRLALANGLMQMLTMVGILAGIGLGGKWFDTLLADFNAADGIAIGNTWRAAELPTITIGLCCLAPILISLLIQRTPAHPEERFQHSIWFQHFSQLSLVLSRDFLRVLALQIAFYWFVANFLGLVFIAFGKELFPDALEGGAAGAGSEMMLYVGIGLMIGSSIVSIISAKRIRPELIPLGAIGMALGLIGVCFLTPLSIGSKGCLAFVGFFSGFFVVPLASLLQNRAPEEERGRILAVSNLLNSLSGIIAIGLSFGLSALKLSASLQTWAVIAPLIIAFFLALPYLRQREPTDGGPTTAA